MICGTYCLANRTNKITTIYTTLQEECNQRIKFFLEETKDYKHLYILKDLGSISIQCIEKARKAEESFKKTIALKKCILLSFLLWSTSNKKARGNCFCKTSKECPLELRADVYYSVLIFFNI